MKLEKEHAKCKDLELSVNTDDEGNPNKYMELTGWRNMTKAEIAAEDKAKADAELRTKETTEARERAEFERLRRRFEPFPPNPAGRKPLKWKPGPRSKTSERKQARSSAYPDGYLYIVTNRGTTWLLSQWPVQIGQLPGYIKTETFKTFEDIAREVERVDIDAWNRLPKS